MKYTVEMQERRFPNSTIIEVDSKEAWKKGKELIDSGQYISVKIFGKYGTMVFHENDYIEYFNSEGRSELIPSYTENIFF